MSELELELESNVVELEASFRKLDPAALPEQKNWVWCYEGIEYLAIPSTSDSTGKIKNPAKETFVAIVGFKKSLRPVPLPKKKLALVPIPSDVTLSKNQLRRINEPFVILSSQQYAAHNAMLFRQEGNDIEADRWMPLLATPMPMVFDAGPNKTA